MMPNSHRFRCYRDRPSEARRHRRWHWLRRPDGLAPALALCCQGLPLSHSRQPTTRLVEMMTAIESSHTDEPRCLPHRGQGGSSGATIRVTTRT
ncbi:hypothetical protein G6F24_016840 [Rhizopus arrhizus]|nr:hypothetical protein G6F24_016840 [Rhizopus arrhizus]